MFRICFILYTLTIIYKPLLPLVKFFFLYSLDLLPIIQPPFYKVYVFNVLLKYPNYCLRTNALVTIKDKC